MDVPRDRILPALGLRLLMVFAFASMSACIKLAQAGGANLAELLFFRQAATFPVILAAVAVGPGFASLRTHRLGAHALRCAVGLGSMCFMFLTVMLLPLAESTILQFTVPIFATILGALILKEPTGWHRWSAVVAGFIGVVIVAQPGSGHIPLLGLATGLLASSLNASVAIMVRSIGKTEAPTTIVFYFSLLSMIPLLPAFLYFGGSHSPATWGWLVATGLVGAVGQLAMTTSLRMAPVSAVVPMDYSGLIWATLYGWVLFAVLPTPMTWVGAPIIVASGLYIVWREHRLSRGLARSTAAVTD